MSHPKIACRNVWKLYGPDPEKFLATHGGDPDLATIKEHGYIPAVRQASLEVHEGEIVVIMGLSGSGKSTLLGVLAGTIEANSGSAMVAGRPPALVQQSTDVDRSLPITVRDTVSLARYQTLGLFRRFQFADRDAIDGAMERLAVDDLSLIHI